MTTQHHCGSGPVCEYWEIENTKPLSATTSVSPRTHTPVSIFFIVVLPCAVLVLENLRTTPGMDQHTPQFLIATRPHLRIVVTCSKQNLVAFSNGNNNPCGAIRLSLVPTTNLLPPEARR